MNNAEWFVDWFNSPYYHLLYNKRDDKEANFFIDNLCRELKLQPGARIWDLACGKGRHSLALYKKGFDVTGTDLAENSILEASRHAVNGLQFEVHDMRHFFKETYFDAVLNLFTSIGYFAEFNDNFLVFKNVAAALKEEGVFVVDFFNSEKVEANINPAFIEQRGDIVFSITKKIKDRAIVKRIEFTDNNKNYYFEENVSLLKKSDFEKFAAGPGLKLSRIYGNYNLDPFNEKTSDRLILIFKR